MLWTVVYRDKTGSTGKMEMEAENRAIVIGNLRARGLQAVNILEGGLQANSRRQKNRAAHLAASAKAPGALRWLLILLLLAAGAGAAWWYVCGQPDLVQVLSEKGRPKPKPKPPGKAVIRIAE